MHSKSKKFITLLICVATILMFTIPVSAADMGITVSGKGVVSVAPDTANMRFAIVTKSESIDKAQEDNSNSYKNVKNALINAGIKSDNIKTSWYRVYPEYRYDQDKETLIGYSVYNNINVTTDDVNNVGKYISIALQSGVTENHGVSFTLSNPQKYYGDALSLSVKNAQISAEYIASALGRTLGSPISVTELGSGNAYEVYEEDAISAEAGVTASGISSNKSYVDYGYDNIDITANVSVVYSFN